MGNQNLEDREAIVVSGDMRCPQAPNLVPILQKTVGPWGQGCSGRNQTETLSPQICAGELTPKVHTLKQKCTHTQHKCTDAHMHKHTYTEN